jgi:exodeoxyribonuclease VII small subunit
MASQLNYNDAYAQLQALVEQLEEGDIPLEELPAKIKQATELIAVCEAKLRAVEEDIDKAKLE